MSPRGGTRGRETRAALRGRAHVLNCMRAPNLPSHSEAASKLRNAAMWHTHGRAAQQPDEPRRMTGPHSATKQTLRRGNKAPRSTPRGEAAPLDEARPTTRQHSSAKHNSDEAAQLGATTTVTRSPPKPAHVARPRARRHIAASARARKRAGPESPRNHHSLLEPQTRNVHGT